MRCSTCGVRPSARVLDELLESGLERRLRADTVAQEADDRKVLLAERVRRGKQLLDVGRLRRKVLQQRLVQELHAGASPPQQAAHRAAQQHRRPVQR